MKYISGDLLHSSLLICAMFGSVRHILSAGFGADDDVRMMGVVRSVAFRPRFKVLRWWAETAWIRCFLGYSACWTWALSGNRRDGWWRGGKNYFELDPFVKSFSSPPPYILCFFLPVISWFQLFSLPPVFIIPSFISFPAPLLPHSPALPLVDFSLMVAVICW